MLLTSANANSPFQQLPVGPPKPGMKDVPVWLKNLRLHKYATLLLSKSYEELMNIDDDQLELWNVTKGARNKILVSVQKLRERPTELRRLYVAMIGFDDVRPALSQLRDMLGTPFKVTDFPCEDFDQIRHIDDLSTDDIAGRIACIVRKAYTIRVNTAVQSSEEDCVNLIVQLVNRCVLHEAFYNVLKSTLHSIKQNLHGFIRQSNYNNHRRLTKSYTTAPDYAPYKNNNLGASSKHLSGEVFLKVPDIYPERTPAHRPLERTYACPKGPVSRALMEYEANQETESIDVALIPRPKTLLHRTASAPVPQKPMIISQYNAWTDRMEKIDRDMENLALRVAEVGLDNFDQTTF